MFTRICFSLFNTSIFKSTSSLVLARVLTSKCNMDMQIHTFLFLDTETTGLPHEENRETKITELCIVAVQADHITLGIPPRVFNKLNLCFNPIRTIVPICREITGLSNELLQHQSEFQKDTVEIIKGFLATQRKPLCLVAHNGNIFDYPILQAEIFNAGGSLPDDIMCIDSLHAFRELEHLTVVEENDLHDFSPQVKVPLEFSDGFDELLFNIVEEVEASERQISEVQKANETTPPKKVKSLNVTETANTTSNINDVYYSPKDVSEENRKQSSNLGKSLTRAAPRSRRQSFKLPEIYTRLTSKKPTEAHRAEYDCSMMIECAAKMGERFVDWANVNAKRFSDVPRMKPGSLCESPNCFTSIRRRFFLDSIRIPYAFSYHWNLVCYAINALQII